MTEGTARLRTMSDRRGVVQNVIDRPNSPSVTIRPIEPDDGTALGRMFFRLSPDAIARRSRRVTRESAPAALRYLSCADHEGGEAVVAECAGEIVGVARYDRPTGDRTDAEVAVVVEGGWQRQGIGHRLVRRLAVEARRRGIAAFTVDVAQANRVAVDLVRSLTPRAEIRFSSGEVQLRAPLPPVPQGPPKMGEQASVA